ncbi:MAG: phosphoribosyltransferase [Thermoleophilia bacterium]|jgi:predicted phosphoribosyltransferase|nr:phosphoribosyltransferase [Thermoleophilia bacterium]
MRAWAGGGIMRWMGRCARPGREEDGVFAGQRDEAPFGGAEHGPAFRDRAAAGRALAARLPGAVEPPAVVVGLARGGVVVAAEVAARLGLGLDAVAVRKVGHPMDPEYAIGAVTPDGARYLRARDGLPPQAVERAVASAMAQATALDARLHARRPPVALGGVACVLVDDGLATGATMFAAVRWARAAGARRVVVACPVGPAETAARLRAEADDVVLVREVERLGSVGAWYERFAQVTEAEVLALLGGAARERAGAAT